MHSANTKEEVEAQGPGRKRRLQVTSVASVMLRNEGVKIEECKNMEGEQDLDYVSSWRLTGLISVQMALKAAIELNVFNIIANSGPQAQLSSAEIVSNIPTTNPNAANSLEKILRMLSANSLLSTSSRPCSNGQKRQERIYGLTPETRCLVTNGDGLSLAPVLLGSCQREFVESFYMLKDVVLEPGCVPFHKANGGANLFECASKKPEFSRVFNESMSASSKIFFDMVLKKYGGFEELTEVMDVGGGIGASLKKIVSVYPHIRGVNFDLPHVIADAPKCPDVDHTAGDMFESLPNAQTILLKWILHDWDDEHCLKLLSNCWKALPDNGKVIVVEYAFPQVSENDTNSLQAISYNFFMMVLFSGGKERTTIEFDDLAKAVGFAKTKFFPIAQGIYVIEFLKRVIG